MGGGPDVTKAGPRAKQAEEGSRPLHHSGPWAAVKTRTMRPLMSQEGRTGVREAEEVEDNKVCSSGRCPPKGLPQRWDWGEQN